MVANMFMLCLQTKVAGKFSLMLLAFCDDTMTSLYPDYR